jgi:hypothetical protein
MIGEVAAVVREVIVVLLTVSGSQLLVDGA